jgi:hypothetical protein
LEPLPKANINKYLQKINNLLKTLPDQVIEELKSREIGYYPDPDSDKWRENLFRVTLENRSSVNTLLEITDRDCIYPTHADALKRYKLIGSAVDTFKKFGGEIQTGAETPFAKYLFDLFMDAKIEEADIPKAIRDYMKNKEKT